MGGGHADIVNMAKASAPGKSILLETKQAEDCGLHHMSK